MKKPSKKVVFICIGLFLFFLVLQFPFKNFRGELFEVIQKNTGIIVYSDDVGLSFFGWPGLVLTNVFVDAPRQGFSLSSEEAVVRVGMGGLFPPKPSFSGSLRALETGGDIWFKYSGNRTEHSIDLEADSLNCALFKFQNKPAPISGPLNAEADLFININDLSQTSGYVTLNSKVLDIAAQNFQNFFKLPYTQLSNLKADISVTNGVATIKEFRFGGPKSELSGSISGEMQLGRTLRDSFLKLRLDVTLSDSFAKDPKSSDLRGFLGGYRVDGEKYAMQWNARIGKMQTDLFSAIPQKVN